MFLSHCGQNRGTPEISRWFVRFCVGVSLSLFHWVLLLSHECLYVSVYQNLLRIRVRKPICRGYLSVSVCWEIETLPFAPPPLHSSHFPPSLFRMYRPQPLRVEVASFQGGLIKGEIKWWERNGGIFLKDNMWQLKKKTIGKEKRRVATFCLPIFKQMCI